jgi:hypothetical protein
MFAASPFMSTGAPGTSGMIQLATTFFTNINAMIAVPTARTANIDRITAVARSPRRRGRVEREIVLAIRIVNPMNPGQ